MLTDGDKAPSLELPETGGGRVRLAGNGQGLLVLYFYPKDDTSGCTLEAKDFSSLRADFAAAGAEVVGISPDSLKSHASFCGKYDLSLRLAADEEKEAAKAFGVWVEKQMYGRRYMGVERSTFLIDEKGRIARSWRNVKVPGHAAEVLAAARALTGS